MLSPKPSMRVVPTVEGFGRYLRVAALAQVTVLLFASHLTARTCAPGGTLHVPELSKNRTRDFQRIRLEHLLNPYAAHYRGLCWLVWGADSRTGRYSDRCAFECLSSVH